MSGTFDAVAAEQRAASSSAWRREVAHAFLKSARAKKMLLDLARHDMLAPWSSEPLKHFEELGLVTGHALIMTNGRLAISKRWSITPLGRDHAADLS